MTVKELIKELNKADMNADVCMGVAAYGEFWGTGVHRIRKEAQDDEN